MVAVQGVGRQTESISWMTVDGFESAINVFVGQNYRAGSLKRVKKEYMTAVGIIFAWGIFTICLLILGAISVSSLFIHEAEMIPAEADYLRIIGFSEMFVCMELITVGAMSGTGKIMEASVITIISTAICVPLAMLLGGTAMRLSRTW